MGRLNSEFVIILNINRILSEDELLVTSGEGAVVND